MKNSILENLSAQVASAEGERNKLAALVASRSASRLKIEAEIDTATTAHNAANINLNELLVMAALGETADLDAARNVLEATAKAFAVAAKGLGLAKELQAIEAGLNARMAPLDATLVELRTELASAVKESKLENLRLTMHDEIAKYVTSANATMAALGKSYALHRALQVEGRDPALFTAALHQSQLGAYAGYPLSGSFAESVEAESARIDALLR